MGDLVIYPNPTKGEINLRLGNINRAQDRLKLKLHDLTGKIIFEVEDTCEVAEQNLKRFVFGIQASGQYVLSVHTRGRTFKKKIQVIK